MDGGVYTMVGLTQQGMDTLPAGDISDYKKSGVGHSEFEPLGAPLKI